MSKFQQGQVVRHIESGDKYVVILLPSRFKIKTDAGWVPGYLYSSARDGVVFARMKDNFEERFKNGNDNS